MVVKTAILYDALGSPVVTRAVPARRPRRRATKKTKTVVVYKTAKPKHHKATAEQLKNLKKARQAKVRMGLASRVG